MLSLLFHSSERFSYSLQNATEGPSQNVSSIWKAKDQRSSVVTWKPDFILYFLAQILMYTGCSGASYVYTCCIVDRARICGKLCIFISSFIKKGMTSLHREMEKGPF
jgi:hypothetical protein